MEAEARVSTAKASIYMKQLCRHFGHNRPAEFDDERGRIEFDFGVCELKADDGMLVFRVRGETEESLERLEQVIKSHFERFAAKDQLEVSWSRESAII